MRPGSPLAALVAALVSLAVPARAAAADPPPEVLDVSSVKEKLLLLTDGNGHHVALVPFGESIWDHLYWSEDGKDFYQQRVFGGRSTENESFSRNFWDPRAGVNGASFDLRGGKYLVSCGERESAFTPVPAERAKAVLGAAVFHPARWKYRAYALARDDSGTYYYVDRRREEGSMEFRLYAGQRGAMKPLRMTNIVSDSEGDVFSTRSGELRLVLDKHQSAWVTKGKRQELRPLPLEDNAVLIYSALGVYTGQRLGTPCDVL